MQTSHWKAPSWAFIAATNGGLPAETSYLLGSSQSSFRELAVAVLSIGADGHS